MAIKQRQFASVWDAIEDTPRKAASMRARSESEALLRDTIETGEVRYRDETRIWIAKRYADRADNMLCVAAVLETVLVIKTVMHHFSWGSGS